MLCENVRKLSEIGLLYILDTHMKHTPPAPWFWRLKGGTLDLLVMF